MPEFSEEYAVPGCRDSPHNPVFFCHELYWKVNEKITPVAYDFVHTAVWKKHKKCYPGNVYHEGQMKMDYLCEILIIMIILQHN